MIGRSGNARAVAIRQHMQRMHDLRMLQLFAAHFSVGDFIYPFLRDEGKEQAKSE